MVKLIKNISAIILTIVFLSCEDNIDVELPKTTSVVVIDAWINNKHEAQTISVLKSIPYFQNSFLPGVNDAEVIVENITSGYDYNFIISDDDGIYIWNPTQSQHSIGKEGDDYRLKIKLGTEVYESFSVMNRVPNVDSILFSHEKENSFFPESYFAQFYGFDPAGVGDTYWIKAWKNGGFLNKPSEINISYDAGGSPGAIIDGVTFIKPVRDGINPFDQDEEDNFLSPYSPGDSVYVELHSINNNTYDFLHAVRIQTDRPGGFSELFAQPLANVSSNIMTVDETSSSVKAIGFFNVSAVSAMGLKLDPDNLPPMRQ